MSHAQDGDLPCPPQKRQGATRTAALFRPKASSRPLAADAQVWRADAQMRDLPVEPPRPARVTGLPASLPPSRDTHGHRHTWHDLPAPDAHADHPCTGHDHDHKHHGHGEAMPIPLPDGWLPIPAGCPDEDPGNAHDALVPDSSNSTAKPSSRPNRRTAPSAEARAQMPVFPELSPTRIHVPNSPDAFEQARQALLAASALGFDTESKPLFQVGQRDTGPHVVQLATPTDAWLLQLHHPQALALAREVMAAPHIAKVGFGLDNDRRSLPHRLGSKLVNVHDLDRVFAQHGYGRNLGVRGAVAVVLQQDFRKSKRTSTSNWAAPQLNAMQRQYAANDAHAPAMLWAALPEWEARQPPLP